MVLEVILYTVGLIALIEGIFVLMFPSSTKKIALKLVRDKEKIRKVGTAEAIVGLILILLGLIL